MKNILVLGGTAWLGAEIVRVFLARGHHVTCLARGSAQAPPAGAQLVAADRTKPGAYDNVLAPASGGAWDAVIELSYEPELVNGALAALKDNAVHWTLVSSVSVYADMSTPLMDETGELVELSIPPDTGDYAQAKVVAERATTAALGERALIVRPGLIGGPGDMSDRFGYWVTRCAQAVEGPVLTPETDGRTVQVIDVRDLANFIATCALARLVAIIDAVGNAYPLATVLSHAGQVAGFAGTFVSASDHFLQDRGVNFWAGPDSLPLWLPAADNAFMNRSNKAFLEHCPSLRPLSETMADILAQEQLRGLDRDRRSGLTRAQELELIGQL